MCIVTKLPKDKVKSDVRPNLVVDVPAPTLAVRFFITEAGNEPVREWLRAMPGADSKTIGADLQTVQYGWPLGMPLVRKMEPDLWEVRSDISGGIARVLFTVAPVADGNAVLLLHGFVKKTQKTPKTELDTARNRLRQHQLLERKKVGR
jgi:phage-related protein